MIPKEQRIHPLLGCGTLGKVLTPVRIGGSTGRIGYFGLTRNHGTKMHKGVDLLALVQWPVFAAHPGIVTDARIDYAGINHGYGRLVYIEGTDKETVSRYAHLMGFCVSAGEKIAAGGLIGLVGRTGNVGDKTPTHLHWEIRKRVNDEWEAVDPLLWLKGEA